MSLILQMLLLFLLGYFVLVLFMYLRQEAFLFFPTSATHEVSGYGNVLPYSLKRGEITVSGWLVNPDYLRESLVIYYGGNAEDVYLNVDEFEALQAATLFVAYRGYGPSGGQPAEADIFADALAIYDDIKSRYKSQKTYLMGRSLGSGVACYVASKRKVDGTILVTPYDTLVAVAKTAYPWLPVSQLLKHRFSSIDYVRNVKSPFLVLYGGRDQIVRPERTRRLLDYIRSDQEAVLIEKGDHGTIDMYPEYWRHILAFINRGEAAQERER
ncbi:MAG: alpha/beta hydrolase [Desulfobulbaceae bacterium]|nr:alpha/beta hydrolase [Desulfobulbaceae bacterium]